MKNILIFLAFSLASMTVQADMALKFFGTAEPHVFKQGEPVVLSDLAIDLMADTGVAVGEEFGCFELPIFDLDSGNQVGFGVDCLNIFDGDDSGAMIEAKTFFFLPQGSLVNHGCTSVRPFWDGVGDSGVTHMTGSIGPAEFDGTNPPLALSPCATAGGVVHATDGMKKFLDGAVRLSGAVNLSVPGEITFSCLFILSD